MYRSSSPYAPPPDPTRDYRSYSPAAAAAASATAIVPGSITYTTSTGPDGRVIYHPYKAVPASYQTPDGAVTGIQWIPAGTTQTRPVGAQPANEDFANSWNRPGHQEALNEWGRDEAKHRRKEEKDAKRQREQGLSQTQVDHERELRMARERDAQAGVGRERRKSFNAGAAGAPGAYGFPSPGSNPGYPVAAGGAGYPSSPYSGYGDRPQVVSGGGSSYPTNTSYNRESKYGTGAGGGYSDRDLDRQFSDLDLDRNRDRDYGSGKGGGMSRPRKYSTSEHGERPRISSGNLGARPEYNVPGPYGSTTGPYNSKSYSSGSAAQRTSPNIGASPHMRPVSPNMRAPSPNMRAPSPNMRATSPNMRPGEAPYIPNTASGYPASNYSPSVGRGVQDGPISRSTTPFGGPQPLVYPRGHVLEGQPIPRSRATSPMPGARGMMGTPASVTGPYSSASAGGGSPNMHGSVAFPTSPQPAQLAAPEGFSRSVNGSLPFTPFDIIKIQDMERFWEDVPGTPSILYDHDVSDRDWSRLMQDIALAWAGRLPVPELSGQRPKRSALVSDLVDLWNSSFFMIRGVEVILYRGRERRSGPHAGVVDRDLPYVEDPFDCPSSSEDTEDSGSSNSDYAGSYGQNVHGMNPMADVLEAGRRRREAKRQARIEEKRKRRERRRRRRERFREKKYALYVTCIPGGPGGHMNQGIPGAYSTGHGGGYGGRGQNY